MATGWATASMESEDMPPTLRPPFAAFWAGGPAFRWANHVARDAEVRTCPGGGDRLGPAHHLGHGADQPLEPSDRLGVSGDVDVRFRRAGRGEQEPGERLDRRGDGH